MLRTIRKYRRSVLGMVSAGLVILAMSGFGVDFFNQRNEPYAIKVGNEQSTYSNFNAHRRMAQERYRRMLGANYFKILESLKINVNQQTVDSLVANLVFKQAATSHDFRASDKAVMDATQTQLFGGNPINKELLQEYLHDIDMTPKEFEGYLRDAILQDQYTGILRDSLTVSKREARASVERQDTTYSVNTLEFSPEKYQSQVAPPTPSEMKSWYEAHQSDFEVAPSASYDYVVLAPQDFVTKVEVTNDDVELEYSENQSKYMTPEEIHVRHIQINLPENADGAKRDEIKKEATDLLAEIKGGKDFAELAKVKSNDTASAMTGGDLGWIAKGKMHKSFDTAAFKLKAGELSDVVETPYGFHLIKVEEKHAPKQKELSEVRAEIEAAIRNREAPAYAREQAQTFYDAFTKDTAITLADFAAKNSLKLESTAGALSAAQDPTGLPKLSALVLEVPDDKKQLQEIGEKSVLVQIKEYNEPTIAAMETVNDKIATALKEKSAKELALKAATEALEKLKAGEYESLVTAAGALGLTTESLDQVGRFKASGILTDEAIADDVFATSTAMKKPSRVFEVKGKFYLVQVTQVKKPEAAEIEKKFGKAQDSERQEQSDALITSVLNHLKADTKIDVSPGVLAQD